MDSFRRTRRPSLRLGLLVLCWGIFSASVHGEDLLPGKDSFDFFSSPEVLGSGAFVAGTGSPQASALNPAANGEEQRILLDAGYDLLKGFAQESQLGHSANLGIVYPTRYAVFAGSLRFLNAPFASLPLGTGINIKASASKELFPRLSFGIGLGGSYGAGGAYGVNSAGGPSGADWGLSADLGVRQGLGDLGYLQNFYWAATLNTLGKSPVPSAFTPRLGISFDALRVPGVSGKPAPFRLGVSSELGFPGFTNMTGILGLQAEILGILTVSSSANFNLREALAGKSASFIPSVGLTLALPLEEGKLGPVSALRPTIGARPLYQDLWAFGLGATAVLGVLDRDPPVIAVDYPKEEYISPNNDGRSDRLDFPLTITDKRYIAAWSFVVESETGAPVRSFSNKERRPENEGVRDIFARIMDVKSGVDVPARLSWDGVDEGGAVVPDGAYRFYIEARDDNGNSARSPRYTVHVDSTPPEVSLSGPETEGMRIFSPDGDGSKDSYTFGLKGSREDRWNASVLDSAGTAVRSYSLADASPADWEWDGKNDSGQIVPDGVYSYRIEAEDRALNRGSAALGNIIVNTLRPTVGLSIDLSDFSPNKDGIKDVLTFSPGVPVTEGLVSWKLEVRNRSDAVRRTFTGTDKVPSAIAFDGATDQKSPLEEGPYQGVLTAFYRNGYEAQVKSPLFNLDISPPEIRVLRPGSLSQRTFSPDGDSRKDTFPISQLGSLEDRWTGVLMNEAGAAIRRYQWDSQVPQDFLWDGKDEAGRVVPDGAYRYGISAQDRAGNSAGASLDGIVLDTTQTAVSLSIPYNFYSPNGDGVLDELLVNTRVQNPSAVENWSIELIDPKGAVRRVLKGPGTAPDRVSFSGTDDKGLALEEGEYQARVRLEYRNGYLSAALSPSFTVDLTPPAAQVDLARSVFSPNGDGNLDTLPIRQSGSAEVSWTGEVLSGDKVLRTYSFSAIPSGAIEWDGLDDAGNLAPDGTYRYRLSSTDRAGNRGSALADGITLSTENTPLMVVVDRRAFSPNGDGSVDEARITPQVQIAEGIDGWKLDILDSAGLVVRTFEGNRSAPAPTVWNGKDARGAAVKDGPYTARAEIRYAMGNRPVAASAPFIVDTQAPAIAVTLGDTHFSPNGDGAKDSARIRRTTAAGDDSWTLGLRDARGQTVRSLAWTGASSDFDWDGKDDSGNLVEDGTYLIVVEGKDIAGNKVDVSVPGLVVDTVAPSIELSVADPAFSPNGDRVKDRLAIAQKAAGDDPWRATISAVSSAATSAATSAAPSQAVQRTWTWKGAGTNAEWDGRDDAGRIVADGTYRYAVASEDAAGNRTTRILDNLILDTQAPQLEMTLPYALFSPNGDSRKDTLPIQVLTSGSDDWTLEVFSAGDVPLASWTWKGAAPSIAWNGQDAAGNVVADGPYRIKAASTDPAGNSTARAMEGIRVDNRIPRLFLTVSALGVSPNGDGNRDSLRFGTVLTLKEGIEAWRLDILDETGMVRRSLNSADAPGSRPTEPPDSLIWNGLDSSGRAREGRHTTRLTVEYAKGDAASSEAGPFMVDISAPVLSVQPNLRYFSPDNDGVEDELLLALGSRDASAIESWSLEIREPLPPFNSFYRIEGKGTPANRIQWDGRSNKGELVQAATDYPTVFTAVDQWGNTGRVESSVGVDVLVIREGDILKIKVPSIIFRENEADFIGLAVETVDNNTRVLRRIAQILNKFRDYKVKVEGHANPVTRTATEEKSELQPLSERRAKSVLSLLVEYGVDQGRLSAIGRGGTQPVVQWEDRPNWWKNRRVEFILEK